MTFQASHNGCDACTSETARNGLLRTPRDYMRRARELQAVGSPLAVSAMRQALVAHAVAAAALRGDKNTTARGLASLRSLSSADETQAQLATLQSQLSARASGIRAQIQAYSQLASGVANVIAAATRDANVMKVVRWIDFILLGRSAPEQLNVAELVDFCRAWNGGIGAMALGLVRAAGAGISAGTRNPQAAQVADTLAAFVEQATTQLCGLVRVDEPAAGGAAVDPGNCRTLVCSGSTPFRRVNSDGTNCECYGNPPASSSPPDPVRQAQWEWERAMIRRAFTEAILKNRNPPATATAQRVAENARLQNCNSSCILQYAEQQYLAALTAAGRTASLPPWPMRGSSIGSFAPATTRPRRYIDSSTAPSNCRCEGQYAAPPGSGGSGGGAVLVGGAAAVGLLAFIAMKK